MLIEMQKGKSEVFGFVLRFDLGSSILFLLTPILIRLRENLSYIREDQTTLYPKRWNFNMCCARMEEWIGFKIGSPKVLTPSDWSMSKRKIELK